MNSFHSLPAQSRLSMLDRLEIEKHRDALAAKQDDFQSTIRNWLAKQSFECPNKQDVLLESYFTSLTTLALDDTFYVVQYHQALHWLNCGLNLNNILLLLNRIQKQFILYSNDIGSQSLGSSLVHFLEIGESIVSTVFYMSRSVDRMKMRCNNEIRRLKHAFKLLNLPLPLDVFQAYIDHQNWKTMVFELALGRKVDLTYFEPSHQRCKLAKWLENGGFQKIPQLEQEPFLHAHRAVHKLGMLAIEESRNNSPEGILELLFEMEKNSEEVMETLLSILERDLLKNAESNSLKGFLDPSLVSLELEKFIAFARRYDFWLDLVMLEIDGLDPIKQGYGDWLSDVVVQEVAGCIQSVARTEDQVFQLENRRFMILALGKEPDGSQAMAERLRALVDSEKVFSSELATMEISVSCGALSFWPGLTMPNSEVIELLEHQLELSKKEGGNRINHQVVDVVMPVMEDESSLDESKSVPR